MRIAPFSTIACLLTAVAAQSGPTSNPPTTPQGFTVTAGISATFSWTPTTSGNVTLTLRNGPSNNLNKGTVVASGIANTGSAFFTVPAGTVSGEYTIEISSDSNASDANYSDTITVKGSDPVASASASASSSSSTSTTTASSSTSSSSTSSSTGSSTITTTSGASATTSGTSTTSHTSASKSSSSSSTAATKSASSASGTSAPTSSTSTPTGTSAETSLGINKSLLIIALGIMAVF